ncbi:hypothetical protein L6164_013735 [Bauhinia variegata]|uniref:Uncharacterized protein n=1 Tax=Bauhinia variegata TaxID=167791 RepID=A0ACB9NEZ9_BAUVA|nr:hypothetical protein L6164_013735 [Bauhinia variegata]
MFKERTTSRTSGRSSSKDHQFEANENDCETSQNPINYPPPRTPLNSIPDPSQYHKDAQESDADSHNKIEFIREKRFEVSSDRFRNFGLSYGTPKVLGRSANSKAQSEPNSAQSTPARNTSRVSLGGAAGIFAGSRVPQLSGGRRGSLCTFLKGISDANSELCTEVPQFELKEDPSFWMDHNVQVLIRIRPLSTMEKLSQGYGRCLRQESAQTLVWVGHPESRFTFDHVACEALSQENLFKVAGVPIVENCLSGYNSCMFAYGQTGSGKTYTMMGEIKETEGSLTDDSGITPRVFDYLFLRIKAEEESRMDGKLRYSCKCSFLEIYNEQITDLLEPSSTNLQLREDMKKGVYVENLTEHSVGTVNDVLKLLLQGNANRKVAATHMNSESSRSHSVFTCIIESRWEKDSLSHFRFARLNLVDLAGSERQKSSFADSERLKEAANINKSLSTLGLVIMTLVDQTHGKPRHVPYRDSRLTFLLQDSLGGNSKTTIIANVSPSICSANETLSTLKFAQRAKLIQNNAKVNEDASGDVSALQWQIQQLKAQLSFLMKHKNSPRPTSSLEPNFEHYRMSELPDGYDSSGETLTTGHKLHLQNKEIKCMKATLVGALRREKMAETTIQNLQAQIERMNYLAQQREEDAQHTALKLRFCEEKIKQLELFVDGTLSAEEYLTEEKRTLQEEIHLLQATIDRNLESKTLTLENDRLSQQLQLYQNFYENGERERLMAEVSELRDQLLVMLQEKLTFSMKNDSQETDTKRELEECWNMNSKLLREVDRLKTELGKYLNCKQVLNSSFDHLDEFQKTDKISLAETISMRSDSGDEMPSYTWPADDDLANKIERNDFPAPVMLAEDREYNDQRELEAKLEKLSKDLEEVKLLNNQYQEKWTLQLSQNLQTESVCEEVEMETTRTILHLQEEIAGLQSELEGRLGSITQENTDLRNMVAEKEEEIRTLHLDWERAIRELTTFLLDGSRSLKDARSQVESITCSFPQVNAWISEHVGMTVKSYIEKEETIQQLQSSLEDAQKTVLEMESKLSSLKEATIALSAFQQLGNDNSSEEVDQLRMLLNEKINMVRMLESEIKDKNNQLSKADKRADAAFVAVKWLYDRHKVAHKNDVQFSFSIPELDVHTEQSSHTNSEDQGVGTHLILNNLMGQVELEKLEILEMESAFNAICSDIKMQTAAFQTGVFGLSAAYRDLIQDLVKVIRDLRSEVRDLEMSSKRFEFYTVDSLTTNAYEYLKFEDQHHTLHQINKGLVGVNKRLDAIENSVGTKIDVSSYSLMNDDLADADSLSVDSSSVSDLSTQTESTASRNKLLDSPSSCSFQFTGEQLVDLKPEIGSVSDADDQESENIEKLKKSSIQMEATASCLRNELDATYDDFSKLYVRFSALLKQLDNGTCSYATDLNKVAPSFHLVMQNAAAGCHNDTEVVDNENGEIRPTGSFLLKFEEAHATVKEADFMVNALRKAYEDAKQSTVMWKQACENMMIERASMEEEIQELKSSVCHKEEESQLLKDHIQFTLLEMANSVSMLEKCFLQVQTDVEKRFKVIHSDLDLMGREMMHSMDSLRSSLEDLCSQIMGEGFASSVLYSCYASQLIVKFSCFSVNHHFNLAGQGELSDSPEICARGAGSLIVTLDEDIRRREQSVAVQSFQEEQDLSNTNVIYENVALRKELERKEELLEGLLFDFRLLQESASSRKDIKDEKEKLIFSLSQVRYELKIKTSQLEDILVQNKKLEGSLTDTQKALLTSNHELGLAKEAIYELSDQNAELRELLKEYHAKNSEAEQRLVEQEEITKGLEKEILNLTVSLEKQSFSMLEGIEDELRMVITERDQLNEEVCVLNEKLEMAYSLADEKEAIATEAHQESEASKLYAKQKEEEVKILEHSVEELEYTINVLEKKVHEMDEEVGRHRLIRESLEMELQALRERMLTNLPQIADSDGNSAQQIEEHISWQLPSKILELHEALSRIKLLEEEKAEQDKEIKQCKEYVSEVVLHAEAQALQYQEKYKILESMFREVKTEMSNSKSTAPTLEKIEKISMRTRGSSSPFRCFANLVQQMNQEKEQELSVTKLRVEELEAVAASRQKEVCMLQTRLAAAENMTHDVIRDLLGVKLDMTNYANLLDQNHIQEFVEEAHHLTEKFTAKEEEILDLRMQMNDLIEERESCISKLKTREADILDTQIAMQQLKERDQLLSAQNEMLKMDKSNLLRKVAELDDMVKTLPASGNIQHHAQPPSKFKDKGALKLGNMESSRRLSHPERRLSRGNDELAHPRKYSGRDI